ncbi:uncharacterized protein LOC126904876 [Daktulosphaira vitifoliae]|uniref:uncharacterized protein LOC126904876 n=1 Tax=Daktulosphaira vitifoliae TaxID=58002 RepID=UPI0021A99D8A|nr:uncharacterized protein LOC126904876 [Daktulosphaira vitifoliae]
MIKKVLILVNFFSLPVSMLSIFSCVNQQIKLKDRNDGFLPRSVNQLSSLAPYGSDSPDILAQIDFVDNERHDFYFNPVDADWQSAIRVLHNFQKHKTYELFSGGSLTYPKIIINTSKNGDSFYKAISYAITGTHDYYKNIRKNLSLFLTNYTIPPENRISVLINYVNARNIQNDGVEAKSVEIYAAVKYFNTCIFVYSTLISEWILYNDLWPFSYNMDHNQQCIYLNKDDNGFYNLVVQVKGY